MPSDDSQYTQKESLGGLKITKRQTPRFKLWYASQLLNSTGNATIEPFLPIFARNIGATAVEVGLLAGLFSLANITQILWARLASKSGKYKLFTFIGKLGSSLLYLPIALLHIGQIFIMILFRFFQGFFTSAVVANETSLMGEYIPVNERSTIISLFSRFNLVGTFTGTLFGGLIFSWLTDSLTLSISVTFAILLIWTGVLGLLSSLIFLKSVPEYQSTSQFTSPESLILRHTNIPSKNPRIIRVRAYLKSFGSFYRFCLFAVIFYFLVHLASPFFIILEIEIYSFTLLQASILTSLSTTCQLLISVYERRKRFIDRFGAHFVLFPSLICIWFISFLVVIPVFFSGISPFLWCICVWIISGLGWGLFNNAIFILLLDIAHPKYRSTLIAIYNTLTGLMMFIAPIIGGIFVSLTNSVVAPFLIRSGLFIVSFVLLVYVKDPEIPATLIFPVRNVFKRYIRATARGGEMMITSIHPKPKN